MTLWSTVRSQVQKVQNLPSLGRESVFVVAACTVCVVLWIVPLIYLGSVLPRSFLNVFCAVTPSLCFWVTAGGLHLLGANEGYLVNVNGTKQPKGLAPSVYTMARAQVIFDVFQTLLTLPRCHFEAPEAHMQWRLSKILLGVVAIDWIEYWTHRSLHTFKPIKWLHKRHHQLIPLHTFGSYYNHPLDMMLVGACLGITLVHVFQLSVLETTICGCLGTICTVIDHCPGRFWDNNNETKPTLTHHEIHHNVNSNANFAQPFTPFLDWLFGTLHTNDTTTTTTRTITSTKPKKVHRKAHYLAEEKKED